MGEKKQKAWIHALNILIGGARPDTLAAYKQMSVEKTEAGYRPKVLSIHTDCLTAMLIFSKTKGAKEHSSL